MFTVFFLRSHDGRSFLLVFPSAGNHPRKIFSVACFLHRSRPPTCRVVLVTRKATGRQKAGADGGICLYDDREQKKSQNRQPDEGLLRELDASTTTTTTMTNLPLSMMQMVRMHHRLRPPLWFDRIPINCRRRWMHWVMRNPMLVLLFLLLPPLHRRSRTLAVYVCLEQWIFIFRACASFHALRLAIPVELY